MATARQYAQWCVMLIEGETFMVDEIYEALIDDNFTDEDGEFIYDDRDD